MMSKIIKEFAIPLGKLDSTSAKETKQRIFRSTFNTYQRHEYADYIEKYKDSLHEKFKYGKFDSLSELSQIISYDFMSINFNEFDNHTQSIWLGKFKQSLLNLNVDSDTINFFIIPSLYDGLNAYKINIMLVIAEIYHDLRTALNAMMIGTEYVNSPIRQVEITNFVSKFKQVMGTYHASNMVDLLNPMESPLMVQVSHRDVGEMGSAYSGTLCFIKQLEDMLDYSSFIGIIDQYTSKRQGIDIESIRETDEIRNFLIEYLNTCDKKQMRNFISCLIKYYDKVDKDYVIRQNKRWFKRIINELNDDTKESINNTIKLLNLSI